MIEFHYVARTGLVLMTPLLQLPKCWDDTDATTPNLANTLSKSKQVRENYHRARVSQLSITVTKHLRENTMRKVSSELNGSGA